MKCLRRCNMQRHPAAFYCTGAAAAVTASPLFTSVRAYQAPGGTSGSPAPSFEIYDIRDTPAEGKLIRVNARDRFIFMSHYPQLGPRKLDPLDPSPQFDFARRSTTRFKIHDVGHLIAVMEGKVPSTNFNTRFHNLEYSKLPDGSGYKVKGELLRLNADAIKWDFDFTKSHVVMFYRFLESSLTEGFGFAPYLRLQKERRNRSQGGASGQRRDQQGSSQRRGGQGGGQRGGGGRGQGNRRNQD